MNNGNKDNLHNLYIPHQKVKDHKSMRGLGKD